MLFDKKLLPYILSEKYITGNGQSREPALSQLYWHTFVHYSGHESRTSDTQLTYFMVVRMSADDTECVVDWVMVDVDL